MSTKILRNWMAGGMLALSMFAPIRVATAADHGDAPNMSHDQGADVGDGFLFLDPNDNSRLFLGYTVRGFIVPGEAVNFAFFDPALQYRFEIENTGDAKPDLFIDVTFTERVSSTAPQTATVQIFDKKRRFTALTTLPNLSPTAAEPTITTNAATGAQFFAGPVDDPFVFDIPAVSRFTTSLRQAVAAGQGQGGADFSLLSRGRDVFAGYSIMAIAIELPVALVRGAATNNEIGLSIVSQRKTQTPSRSGAPKTSGKFLTVDRTGNPALNAVFIPINHRNLVNGSTQLDDAAGKFDADIIATATAFGVNAAFQDAILNVYVRRGDYLRLKLNVPNTRSTADVNAAPAPGQTAIGDGDNREAAFPNGRRLSDDVVNTLLTIVANGTTLGDSADRLDVPLRAQFPFFGPPQQPRAAGVVDDLTRN